MQSALSHIDDFLRGRGRFNPAAPATRPWWWLPAIVVATAPLYGGVMGSFHFDAPERAWQILFAAVKLPLLLFATTLLCLPGFFVLNTILGLRDDLRDAFQAILAGQAALSIALAALAPFIRFWYFSAPGYRNAQLGNMALFTLATLAGHLVMLRYYRTLITRNPHHRITLYLWLVLYAFVGIQMGWIARPFLGAPGAPVAFFRDEPFSNAYVVVAHLLFGS